MMATVLWVLFILAAGGAAIVYAEPTAAMWLAGVIQRLAREAVCILQAHAFARAAARTAYELVYRHHRGAGIQDLGGHYAADPVESIE